MRISDWSSDVCSSDLRNPTGARRPGAIQVEYITPHKRMHLGASTTDCMECSKSLNGSIIGRPPLRGRGTGVSIAFSRRCGGGRGVGTGGESSACPPSQPYFSCCGYGRSEGRLVGTGCVRKG